MHVTAVLPAPDYMKPQCCPDEPAEALAWHGFTTLLSNLTSTGVTPALDQAAYKSEPGGKPKHFDVVCWPTIIVLGVSQGADAETLISAHRVGSCQRLTGRTLAGGFSPGRVSYTEWGSTG